MKKNVYLIFICFYAAACFAQKNSSVSPPSFSDKFSEYVAKLEAGQTAIDYQDFRYSFVDSEQFIVANNKKPEMDKLSQKMYKSFNKADYKKAISVTQKILSIDYTNLMAHKILGESYELSGDTAKSEKYKKIQTGLLNSILEKGDGKSCSTAWPVIQVAEEYFILEMLGANLQTQSTIREDELCDKMDVKVKEEQQTYYFGTTKVFQGYIKLGVK